MYLRFILCPLQDRNCQPLHFRTGDVDTPSQVLRHVRYSDDFSIWSAPYLKAEKHRSNPPVLGGQDSIFKAKEQKCLTRGISAFCLIQPQYLTGAKTFFTLFWKAAFGNINVSSISYAAVIPGKSLFKPSSAIERALRSDDSQAGNRIRNIE